MTTIRIQGMSCQHCVDSTRKALEALPGILDVHVDLAKGEARFKGSVDRQAVREAIARIGFEIVDE